MNKLTFFAGSDNGDVICLQSESSDGVMNFSLSVSEFSEREYVEIYSPELEAVSGEEGFYILPGDEKASGSALVRFCARSENDMLIIDNPTLNFYAVGKADATYVVMMKYNYLYTLRASCQDGKYRVFTKIKTSIQPTTDSIELNVLILPQGADYNAVAKAVRNYCLDRGEIRPLALKCAEREELEYARKYPLVRIRMGWKPVPPDVLHQTEENEPDMHVACTFARVRELADAMKARGIEGAEISLVGWNVRGHDGRWPQMLPPDEALGGEAELRKTVKHVQSLGYRITCHTNSGDHYEIADSFDFSDIAKARDGSLKTTGKWAGGLAYAACPDAQIKYAKRDLPVIRELGFRGLHYIDCVSLVRPTVCFDPAHPSGVSASIEKLCSLMRMTREALGGFSSEGIRDFSVGELDFSLYNSFRSPMLSFYPESHPMIDGIVPMIELIYHGITLYNPSSATVNAPVKGGEATSALALLCGRPALYLYSKFITKKEKPFISIGDNWMGEEDLGCDDAEDIERSVSAIASALAEYELYRDRQLVFMDSYRCYDGGLKVVKYEDGVEIAANHGEETVEYRGQQILPASFKIYT